MNAYLLPGNSLRHREWVENFKRVVNHQFDTVTTQHYKHWQTGGSQADVAHEIDVASAAAQTLSPYTLIAKSIGTVIAINGTSGGALHPDKIILLGIPLNGSVDREVFTANLQRLSCPVTIIQNTSDPFGSFEEVHTAFENAPANVTFVEFEGDTHDYLDFQAIAQYF